MVAYASLGAGDLIGHEVVKAVAHATGKTPAQVKTCPEGSARSHTSISVPLIDDLSRGICPLPYQYQCPPN